MKGEEVEKGEEGVRMRCLGARGRRDTRRTSGSLIS